MGNSSLFFSGALAKHLTKLPALLGMTVRTLSRIRQLGWVIAWLPFHLGTVVGELTTSLVPRQTGYGWGGGGGPPPAVISAYQTCAGHDDYDGCLLPLGGGCCSKGLSCQLGSICVGGASNSTTTTVLCDQGWSSCPSSQGGRSARPWDSEHGCSPRAQEAVV